MQRFLSKCLEPYGTTVAQLEFVDSHKHLDTLWRRLCADLSSQIVAHCEALIEGQPPLATKELEKNSWA